MAADRSAGLRPPLATGATTLVKGPARRQKSNLILALPDTTSSDAGEEARLYESHGHALSLVQSQFNSLSSPVARHASQASPSNTSGGASTSASRLLGGNTTPGRGANLNSGTPSTSNLAPANTDRRILPALAASRSASCRNMQPPFSPSSASVSSPNATSDPTTAFLPSISTPNSSTTTFIATTNAANPTEDNSKPVLITYPDPDKALKRAHTRSVKSLNPDPHHADPHQPDPQTAATHGGFMKGLRRFFGLDTRSAAEAAGVLAAEQAAKEAAAAAKETLPPLTCARYDDPSVNALVPQRSQASMMLLSQHHQQQERLARVRSTLLATSPHATASGGADDSLAWNEVGRRWCVVVERERVLATGASTDNG